MYKPEYHASWGLVIGINSYKHLSPLSYACNDANAIHGVLLNDLDFPASQVTLLKDGAATRNAIFETFLSFAQKANHPDDRVVVFFAGHGMTYKGQRGQIGYLVPVDGEPNNYSSLLRWDDLTRNADLIPAKHILFIMDACYSGLAMQRTVTPGTQRFLSNMLQRFSRQVITAGKADETVADGGGPKGENSIFTGYLLQGLQGAAKDSNGVLTANALMNFVYQKVGQDSRSKQTPSFGHIDGDGDFVLLSPNHQHLKASLQQDYLLPSIVEVPETLFPPPSIVRPSYADLNGYTDSRHPNFGRNESTNKLGEVRRVKNGDNNFSKAFSWLSLIVEPLADQPISMDISKELERLKDPYSFHRNSNPYERFPLLRNQRTTIDSLILSEELAYGSEFLGCYLHIENSGNIEYVNNSVIFIEFDGVRCFRYVPVIGLIWQFIFLAKWLLGNVGYTGGVRYLVSLVGTQDTVLTDFSQEIGQSNIKWMQPFSYDDHHGGLLKLKCPTPNLQMRYELVVGNLNEPESRKIVDDVARQLGLAFNHQSEPRCFNYCTNTFPWKQYLPAIS